ncbi:IS66 family insertion sequence element accessory protein TnpB [Mesorhizobium captivum]|uniref:IS66 family insertion sequence element accessory protein TnpB n=1 Tax=Mesorhizobium captivum TaxID=3072319 RepID=UPI003D6C606B
MTKPICCSTERLSRRLPQGCERLDGAGAGRRSRSVQRRLYVFRSKRADRTTAVWWDASGVSLLRRRLRKQRSTGRASGSHVFG